MREESHLDEMRDAIRGDFERLAERRGDQQLLRVTDPESPDQAEEPEPEAVLGRRSWLARLIAP